MTIEFQWLGNGALHIQLGGRGVSVPKEQLGQLRYVLARGPTVGGQVAAEADDSLVAGEQDAPESPERVAGRPEGVGW